MPKRDFASLAYKRFDFYCHDAANGGDDSNDGLSVSTPKLTFAGIAKVLPTVASYPVVIHLKGTFTDQTFIMSFLESRLHTQQGSTPKLLIDGGDDVTVVADNGGNNYTITASSTEYVTTNEGDWTAGQHDGYWLQIVGGPADGQLLTLADSSTTTMWPTKKFLVDPVGGKFRIVKPSTSVIGTSALGGFQLTSTLGYSMYIQKILVGGTQGLFSMQCKAATLRLASCVFDAGSFQCWSADWLYFWNRINSSTFASEAHAPGTSIRHTNIVYLQGIEGLFIRNAYMKYLTIAGTNIYDISQGTRLHRLYIRNSFAREGQDTLITTAGYNTTKIKGSPNVGLEINDSYMSVGNIDISDSTSHGIESTNSRLYCKDITGTGNGGAGLYAHSGSQVTIKDGSPPTLTGTVGDIAINDSTYEEVTWSTIDGGESFHSAQEATIIKEVA